MHLTWFLVVVNWVIINGIKLLLDIVYLVVSVLVDTGPRRLTLLYSLRSPDWFLVILSVLLDTLCLLELRHLILRLSSTVIRVLVWIISTILHSLFDLREELCHSYLKILPNEGKPFSPVLFSPQDLYVLISIRFDELNTKPFHKSFIHSSQSDIVFNSYEVFLFLMLILILTFITRGV